jgi:F-type H+-transporting ATPase subunit gamma
MKMVSASKLRRAQNAILSMRPYANKLREIMRNLSHDLEGSGEGAFSADRGSNKILIIPISSNRGLCGAFNANVSKATANLIHQQFQNQYNNGNVHIFGIGKKGVDGLKSLGFKADSVNTEIFDNLNFGQVVVIANQLMADFANKKYDRIILIYNQFKNAAVQVLQTEQLLPVAAIESAKTENVAQVEANYIYEPGKAEILAEIVPKTIKIQLYKALLDSNAAEHGARMTAMHKATENADELLKALNLSYNKARQAAITNEILEIVGGAEALKG